MDHVPDAARQPKPRFENRSKSSHRGASERTDKPKPPRRPKPERADTAQPVSRPDSDAAAPAKPRAKKVWSDTPLIKHEPKPNASPIDWNDTSTPKPRKPKPGAKPKGKPRGKPATRLERAIQDGAVSTSKKTRHKAGGKGKPAGNGAPAVGKPNSKKNKARRAAAKSGGTQPPRRKP